MYEFDLIQRYFANHPGKRSDVILGVGDDCAILQPPPDQQLVMTADTLVENIHFLKNADARELGYKSLAVSLSDAAAMGAEPAWAMLMLTLPQVEENWLKNFCVGFYSLLDQFNLTLIGGNTTQGKTLTITTQVTGFVPPGEALKRSGAKPGDLIYVTGTLGDAGFELKQNLGWIKRMKMRGSADDGLIHPTITPRINEGIILRHLATACIDISDGLAADLQHILTASQVGATIKTNRLPLSKTLREQIPRAQAWQLALTSGEDYELCFTIPPQLQNTFELQFGSFDCGYICIGTIDQQPGLRVLDPDGKPFPIGQKGYEHFRQ